MSQLAREVVLGQTSECVNVDDFTRMTGSQHGSVTHLSAEESDVEAATQRLLPSAPGEEETSHDVADAATAPTSEQAKDAKDFSSRVRLGINASWAVNVMLLVTKVVAFILSGSYAVLASAVDSLVDLLSQAVLAIAEYQIARFDQRFPIGRTRMAELSVLACAGIMFVSTTLVMREAGGALWEGFHGDIPRLETGAVLFATLGIATVAKLALYLYCFVLRKNPIMVALSEDHLNDVMSNVAAIVGAAVAGNLPRLWYVDPIVALVFSLLIIRNWVAICTEQAQKMIGLAAPCELIQAVTGLTERHHPLVLLDRVTAYHHGSHTAVEVEVLMPPDMSVRQSHDIALALQHKIEALDSVERAFVHVDYERRPVEEHKVERNLKQGVRDVMQPLAGYDAPSPTAHSAALSCAPPPAGPLLSPAAPSAAPQIDAQPTPGSELSAAATSAPVTTAAAGHASRLVD